MKELIEEYSFKVTPIFDYIKVQTEQAGLYIHYGKSKETLQFFLSKESFIKNEKYIGAIQYEGSNDYAKKEPHLVSWRFKRANISNELKQDLESILSFRRDKNIGPKVNSSTESISFKFEYWTESIKETIEEIGKSIKNEKQDISNDSKARHGYFI